VIRTDLRWGYGVITIDRPERRNAVDLETLVALREAIDSARQREVRALVLTGAGGNFCAGADLTGVGVDGFADSLRRVLTGLTDLPAVTIAAVDGAALGAGAQLAAACDLRVATATARFGVPAARLGIMVDRWTVQRLVALVGGGTARAMLLAAVTYTGDDAHRLGFVQRIGTLDDAVAWATTIAELAPLSNAGHKLVLEHPDDTERIAEAIARAWASADAIEGPKAFLDKRKPWFTGN
jgi:enoyl-CoA hydratase